MLAAILGRKYGVQVKIGGDKACTNGNVIHLPSLPLESDDVVHNLVRSYLDHESAHIRHTAFDVLNDPSVTHLTKCLWNIFEDWRVENSLAKIYPGCRVNFDWLIERHFGKDAPKSKDQAAHIVNYILFSVRAWDVAAIEKNKDILGKQVENNFPNLYKLINDALAQVKVSCHSSYDCMDYAKEIVKLIENESVTMDSPENPEKNASLGELKKLLNISENELPDDLGKCVANELESSAPQQNKGLTVATEASKIFQSLESKELEETRRASTALHARLQSLLQSSILVRRSPGRFGKLDTNRLFRLGYSPKLFLRNEEKQGVSTAIHALLDCSTSMRYKMDFACKACYAIADSLHKINGINIAVTAFPSDPIPSNARAGSLRTTVSPLLKHGQNMHANFKMKPSGSTPMGEAIWKVMQDMYFLKENRKIILILTDGKADSVKNAEKAIEMGAELGFEFYGIGINDSNIMNILPKTSQVVNILDELAPAMFKLLQNALLHTR